MFKQRTEKSAFGHLRRGPVEHFNLCFYGAVLRLIERVALSLGSFEAAFSQFPFLVGYNNELAAYGLDGMRPDEASEWWQRNLLIWERASEDHLPIVALRDAAQLDHDAMTIWMTIGLIEEEARFGALFAALQGRAELHRPTVALLNSWWNRESSVPGGQAGAQAYVRRLEENGLVQVINRDAPRIEWALQAPGVLWDAARGERSERPAPWLLYREPERLTEIGDLIVPESMRPTLARLPALLATGEVRTVVVRGHDHNGRKTLLGAVARQLGRGLLKARWLNRVDDERWRSIGPLATALRAMPVICCDPAPGETVEAPPLPGYDGPIGIALGLHGGLNGDATDRAISLTLDVPDVDARRRHWLAVLGAHGEEGADLFSERYRMTGGNVRRAAQLATAYAALDERRDVNLSDVQQASRALNRQSMETLATRIDGFGDWGQLAVGAQTLTELYDLESRCRHRERLHLTVGKALGSQLNPGVRALFSGPSGTGKTLAARLLASVLNKDLYRLDLSAVINKYIGETEKSLNRIFSRAEELDVILLLDEGDALLAQRTGVQNSNDRYANLETNYLLQRLETFEGILIVTTNAADRIDTAFQRRMDVVVDFRPPDAAERLSIWQLHLPQAHQVDYGRLIEIAGRCALTGGQVRNVTLHAALLALNDGGTVSTPHLEAALQREYRKSGAVCPLRIG